MRLILLVCGLLLFLSCQSAGGGQKSVTFYLDGARVEQEAAAVNGYLEYALPDSVAPGSLRVKPLGGGTILRVELVPADRDRRRAREIARLEDRKGELQVRMQILSSREEIFSAAAKSQSGKALRKSKANPDPLGSLQQGTEFALARLDTVYRRKRKVQHGLDRLEHELTVARKGAALARIWLSGGRARVSYLVSNERWTPCYDFRWSGADASGELLLHARLPQPEKGVRYLVSTGTAAQGVAAKQVRGDFPILSRHPLTLQSGIRNSTPPMTFSFETVQAGLPPGEAAAFWRGEYLGSGQFSGAGASEVSIGR
ncbi:MAG: hypothetical protein A2075_01315 [Geobacteraceae bacterium GWC2_58_44]|nr:MAG: hypothetical protein A2075_01315 [Geobacteraceae bacterium GWC2_58_44]HBG06697.1 hypothetical protein [Geobacter sp.]